MIKKAENTEIKKRAADVSAALLTLKT